MLQQSHSQHIIMSHKMIHNLSILQMNRVALSLFLLKISDENPLITSKNVFTPWNSTLDPSTFEDSLTQEKKLFDSLREELFLEIKEADYPLMYLIIGNLTPEGFLSNTLTKISAGMGIEYERLDFIHGLIKSSSIKGLASFDHPDYLSYLVGDEFGKDSFEMDALKVFLRKTKNKSLSLDLLAREAGVSLSVVEELMEFIKNSPKTPLFGENAKPIYPDFYIEVNGEDIVLTPSRYVNPKINVENRLNTSKVFVKQAEQLQFALDFRFGSLKNYAEILVNKRKDFFLENGQDPNQIILKDIAELTGRHVSTVSRALKNSYFMFRGEIYPFYTLLTNALGDKSTYLIKKNIKELILNEDQFTPLSDGSITRILEKKGINIARRTVNKYRKQLQLKSLYWRS